MQHLKLNKRNLVLRAREDLDQRRSWQDGARRTEQYQVWTRYFTQLALTDCIRVRLQLVKTRCLPIRRWRHPLVVKLRRLFPRTIDWMRTYYLRYIAGPVIEAKAFDSIISAAQYADDYYRGALPSRPTIPMQGGRGSLSAVEREPLPKE